MKCFFTLAINITDMKRHSDILILQKQIKQQITVYTLQSSVMQLTRTGPKSRWKLKSKHTRHFESQYQTHQTFFQTYKSIHFYGKGMTLEHLPATDIKARGQQWQNPPNTSAKQTASFIGLSSLNLDSEPNTSAQSFEGSPPKKSLLRVFSL